MRHLLFAAILPATFLVSCSKEPYQDSKTTSKEVHRDSRGYCTCATTMAGKCTCGHCRGENEPCECGKPKQDSPNAVDALFTDADGKTVKLSQFRGKSVVLLFMRGFTGDFACHYCGLQTKEYKDRYEALKAAGAEVLMVLPGAKDVKGYLQKVGENLEPPDDKFTAPFAVVLDTDLSACKAFGVPAQKTDDESFPVDTPATIVIAKDGSIAYTYIGRKPDDRPKVDEVLAALRGGTANPRSEEKPRTTASSIAWMGYEEGLTLAKNKSRPILLDFFAEW